LKSILTYSFSIFLLIIFLVNSQGVFIEHHDCSVCNITNEDTSVNHDCNKGNMSCCEHDFIQNKHAEFCDIYDFNKEHHHNSCSCFAEYFQIPVFQSESKKTKDISASSLIVFSVFLKNQIFDTTISDIIIQYTAPPESGYKNIPIHIINCSFLC